MRRALAFALALALSSPAFAAVDAKGVWLHHCKGCHGLDGKGDTPMGHKNKTPDMTSAKFMSSDKNTDAKLKDAIENGVKDTKMKPYKEKLSADEIAALVGYIHTLQGK